MDESRPGRRLRWELVQSVPTAPSEAFLADVGSLRSKASRLNPWGCGPGLLQVGPSKELVLYMYMYM